MKTIKLAVIALFSLGIAASLSGCNKDIFGTTYTFNYAQVRLPDGRIKEGKVKAWAKYGNQDSVRVKFVNGEVYYTNSVNVVLYDK